MSEDCVTAALLNLETLLQALQVGEGSGAVRQVTLNLFTAVWVPWVHILLAGPLCEAGLEGKVPASWPSEVRPQCGLQGYPTLLAFHGSNRLAACPTALRLLLISVDQCLRPGPRPLPPPLLGDCSIIFLFFNEALRSIYIAIHKAVPAGLAVCLSHRKPACSIFLIAP